MIFELKVEKVLEKWHGKQHWKNKGQKYIQSGEVMYCMKWGSWIGWEWRKTLMKIRVMKNAMFLGKKKASRNEGWEDATFEND